MLNLNEPFESINKQMVFEQFEFQLFIHLNWVRHE